MLPSLCPMMAAIPSVSCPPCRAARGRTRGQGRRRDSREGQVRPQLNRITCRYLAAAVPGLWHAYSEWSLCGRVANRTVDGLPPSAWRVARVAGGGRKEPPLAGACTECGVLG